MSNSRERQESRNTRWQDRQREESHETNRNRLEPQPQGEHSGQSSDSETENRWENDPTQNYSNPRQSNTEPNNNNAEYDSRHDPQSRPKSSSGDLDPGPANSNREWVSGTGQPPYQEERPSLAGRGPQGDKRSDDRVAEDINEAMTTEHDLDATSISVEVKDGEVVLKGTVSDRKSKRRAEEIAESCSGVKDVQNQIRIKRADSSDSGRDSKGGKGNDKRSTKLAS